MVQTLVHHRNCRQGLDMRFGVETQKGGQGWVVPARWMTFYPGGPFANKRAKTVVSELEELQRKLYSCSRTRRSSKLWSQS